MNLDRAALDAARKLNGNLPPLTDAEFLALKGDDNLSEEEKLAQDKLKKDQADAEIERQRLADLEIGKLPKELSDTELLEILSKKTGRSYSSLKDLVPAEIIDAEKAAEERENEKFAWGLKSKKIKQKDVENFIAASKDPKGLVYEMRLHQARKEDKNLDEKEFEAEFNDEFGIESDKSSRRYKNGQDTLSRLSEAILQKNYPSIFSLENEFSGHEKSQNSSKERQSKVKTETPAFNKSLDKVFNNLKKIKAQFDEGDEYEVETIEENLNTIRQSMSSPDWIEKQILEGYTEEGLQEVAYTALLRHSFPILAKKIAIQYLKKHAAGTKGILTLKHTAGEIDDTQLTDEQKKLKSIIKENSPQPAQAN